MRPSFDGRRKSRTALLLGLILLFAALARFYGLDYHSFRNDELASWSRSNHETFAEVIEYGVRPDPHPPGYNYIVWMIDRHIGDGEVVLRAPSAIVGVLAVWVIFLLGRRTFGDREGLVAAALMASSFAGIYWSQDVRAYAFLILTAITSSYFLWPLVRDMHERGPPSMSAALGFTITSAIASYLHYFGVVLFAVQIAYFCGLALFGRRWSHFGCGVLIFVGAALLYMPWWGGFFEDLTARAAPDWIVKPGKEFPFYFLEYTMNHSAALATAAFVLLAFILVSELRRIWSDRQQFSLFDEARTPEFFVAYWFLAPFVLSAVKSYISEPVTSLRNLTIIIPALYLILARALALLPAAWKIRGVATAAVLTLAVYQLLFDVRYYTTPQKHQFRHVAQYVVDHEAQRPEAPVYAYAFTRSKFDYYLERLGGGSRVSFLAGSVADIEPMAARLEADRPWAFWYLTGIKTPDPAFLDYLQTEYELTDELLLYETSARFYVRSEAAASD